MHTFLPGALCALACLAPQLHAQSPTTEELDAALQRATAGGYWGAALVVHEGETLLRRGYGDADYAGTPNTPGTLFEIASVTKQFTAATVLTLVEQGELSLDTTLGELFPDRAKANNAITIRHLLTHTSGISANGTQPYASTIDRAEFLDAVFTHPPDFEPGSGSAYSNVGYALLAAIVEEVTGESFESVMLKRVFEPAGLQDTGFVNDTRLDRSRAATRLSERTPDATAADWFYGWGYRGMGGVVTTIDDLLLWHRALSTDRVLSAAMRDALFTPDSTGTAFGWNIASDPLGNPVARHGGAVEGFRSVVRRHLEEDSLIVLLSNSNAEPFRLIEVLDDELRPVPTATLRIDAGDRPMGQFGQVQLDEESALRVEAIHSGLRIELVDGEGNLAASLDTPHLVARPFAKELEAILRQRGDDNQPEPRTEAGVYLYAYNNARQVDVEGIAMNTQPRYRGRGENGEIITDERVLVTFIDESKNFWPVMIKMNTKAARTFLDAVNKALEER